MKGGGGFIGKEKLSESLIIECLDLNKIKFLTAKERKNKEEKEKNKEEEEEEKNLMFSHVECEH